MLNDIYYGVLQRDYYYHGLVVHAKLSRGIGLKKTDPDNSWVVSDDRQPVALVVVAVASTAQKFCLKLDLKQAQLKKCAWEKPPAFPGERERVSAGLIYYTVRFISTTNQ